MKSRIFILLMVALTIFSCEKIKDVLSVDIDTTLQMDMPVTVTSPASALKSTLVSSSFSEVKTLSLAENEDVADYLSKIESITLKSVDASIFGLTGDQEIETLTVSVTGVGEIFTLENITPTSTVSASVLSAVLDQISAKLESDKSITVTATGSTNFAPMVFDLKLAFDSIIKAGALN